MHRSALWGLVAALLVGVTGCAAPAGPRLTVNVTGDKFSKSITLEGLPMIDPHNGDGLFWMLRSFVDPQSHVAVHQIYAAWTYAGHSSGRYFAADDTARSLPVTMILKESCPFDKCDRTDTMGIGIDEATLRARAASGFEVKLSAQDGTYGIIQITPKMISAQLDAENRVLTGQSTSVPTVSGAAIPPNGGVPAAAVVPRATAPSGKPLLGVAPIDLLFGVGVMISRVDPDTPAQEAGFEVGDMVTRYNEHLVTKADQFRELIGQTPPGALVHVEITRRGAPMTLAVQM